MIYLLKGDDSYMEIKAHTYNPKAAFALIYAGVFTVGKKCPEIRLFTQKPADIFFPPPPKKNPRK